MTDDKLYTSPSANTIMAKLANHVYRTNFITSSTDKYYSLDSPNRCQQLPPHYKRLIHDRNETDKRTSNRPTCSHGGGGPQVGEVPRLGGVTNLSIQSFFFSWLLSHERWGTSPRRVARSAVPGNPLRWGKFSPCECWRWGGVMFSWPFIHYKTNWKADRAA